MPTAAFASPWVRTVDVWDSGVKSMLASSNSRAAVGSPAGSPRIGMAPDLPCCEAAGGLAAEAGQGDDDDGGSSSSSGSSTAMAGLAGWSSGAASGSDCWLLDSEGGEEEGEEGGPACMWWAAESAGGVASTKAAPHQQQLGLLPAPQGRCRSPNRRPAPRWWRSTVRGLAHGWRWLVGCGAVGWEVSPSRSLQAWEATSQAGAAALVGALGAPMPAANLLSWLAVDRLAWLGFGCDIVQMRRWQLGLPARGPSVGAHALHLARVATTYLWSPSLLPKPADWGPEVNVVGFVGAAGGSDSAGGGEHPAAGYQPPEALAHFLAAGPPPVYIGFGSLVLPNPQALARTCVEAATAAGVRIILHAGWGGLGSGLHPAAHTEAGGGRPQQPLPPSHVLLLAEPVPHDWLFPLVRAVVHHGGAGTAACGLRHGRPTLVVPFFGDQHLWGSAVHAAGAGPAPLCPARLTRPRLAASLRELLDPAASDAAGRLAAALSAENGAAGAVAAFHAHLAACGLAGGSQDLTPSERAARLADAGRREWARLRGNLEAAAARHTAAEVVVVPGGACAGAGGAHGAGALVEAEV